MPITNSQSPINVQAPRQGKNIIVVVITIAIVVVVAILLLRYFRSPGSGTPGPGQTQSSKEIPAGWPAYLALDSKDAIQNSNSSTDSQSGKALLSISYTSQKTSKEILDNYKAIFQNKGFNITGQSENGEILFIYAKKGGQEDISVTIDTRQVPVVVTTGYLK